MMIKDDDGGDGHDGEVLKMEMNESWRFNSRNRRIKENRSEKEDKDHKFPYPLQSKKCNRITQITYVQSYIYFLYKAKWWTLHYQKSKYMLVKASCNQTLLKSTNYISSLHVLVQCEWEI